MVITHKRNTASFIKPINVSFSTFEQSVEEPKIEEVIPTFEEEIPVVEDYNQESLLNEINTFLATYDEEEEESLGED